MNEKQMFWLVIEALLFGLVASFVFGWLLTSRIGPHVIFYPIVMLVSYVLSAILYWKGSKAHGHD